MRQDITTRYQRLLLLFCCLLLFIPISAQELGWEEIETTAAGTSVRLGISIEAYSVIDYLVFTYQQQVQTLYDIEVQIVQVSRHELSALLQGETAQPYVDALWVTRADLYMLHQAGLLNTEWTSLLPNLEMINEDRMTVLEDLGDGARGVAIPAFDMRFQLVFDTSAIDHSLVPTDLTSLTDWIESNPGRFTYIIPDSVYGNLFLQQIMIMLSGGYEQWQGPFDPELYERWSQELWVLLNRWKPNLWDRGRSYPQTINQANALLNNGETDFSVALSLGGAEVAILDGEIPDTSQGIILSDQAVGDYIYYVISESAPNPAGAMVFANLLLEPRNQASQLLPANGFGFGHVLDLQSITDVGDINTFSEAFRALSSVTPSFSVLNSASVPGLAPEYALHLEHDWYVFVGN